MAKKSLHRPLRIRTALFAESSVAALPRLLTVFRFRSLLQQQRLWRPAGPDPTVGDDAAFGSFLAGLLDGDGCAGVDKRGYGFAIFTGHRSEAPLLAAVARRLGSGRLYTSANGRWCRLRLTSKPGLERLLVLALPYCRHPGRLRQLRWLAWALVRPTRRRSGAVLAAARPARKAAAGVPKPAAPGSAAAAPAAATAAAEEGPALRLPGAGDPRVPEGHWHR